jgi:hypothetical protein
MPATKLATKPPLVTKALTKLLNDAISVYGMEAFNEAFCQALRSRAVQIAQQFDDPDLAVLYNDFADHIADALRQGHKITKATSVVLKSTGKRKFLQGENHPASTIFDEDVMEMRKRVYDGEDRTEVFNDFKRRGKVRRRQHFNSIIRGDAWGHLVTGYEVRMKRGGKTRQPRKPGRKPRLTLSPKPSEQLEAQAE